MYYGKVEISGINTSKLKVLSEAEKAELLERTAKGDMKAREELINGNLRLVLSVIQKFTGRGESPDDLFQVGCIGLIKAIDNFAPEFGVRFSTYAVRIVYSSRNTCKKGSRIMSIKRKKAFDIAISAIRSLPLSEENAEAIEYLEAARNERYIKYDSKTPDEWIVDFIEQYETLLPSSADDYDLRRRTGTPAWITVARYAKLSTWYELISFTGVSQHCLKRKFRLRSEPKEWTVRSTSHFLDEYIKLKEHIDEIFENNC